MLNPAIKRHSIETVEPRRSEVMSDEQYVEWQKRSMLAHFFGITSLFNSERSDLNSDTGEFTIFMPSALKGKISKKVGPDAIEMAAGATLAITKIVKGRIDFAAKELIFIGKDQITIDKGLLVPTFSVTRISVKESSYEFTGIWKLGSGSMTYTKSSLDATIKYWEPKEIKDK